MFQILAKRMPRWVIILFVSSIVVRYDLCVVQEILPTEEEDLSEDAQYYTTDEIVNTGISAIALYDYQAAADDEVSFDPDDVITHIEKV
jgi:hypothetical protein